MKQKLIFLDIDGTLLPPGEMTVPASAVEAIRQARANGHKVFLCTGRNLRMTKPLLAYGFDGFVCSAGGYVGCDGKILVDLPMEPAQVEGLREVLGRAGAECTLEARDDTYGGIRMIERFAHLFPRKPGQLNSEAERWRKTMEYGLTIRPIEEYHGEPVYKVVFIAPNEACLAEAKQLYEDQFIFCESRLGATIFKGTVDANLRMAKPDATEAELWAALEQVNLADFCRSQDGLQTALHEGGSNLSGGQRQRLAMARALLHDTPIYLFDEATSNVDAESENDIMAAIRSLAGRKTVILISHRLANVVDSDCIYVLDKGRIAERGTHAELLKKQGAYSRLYTAQKQLETLETEDA